jgi:hypothetical protein
VVHTCGSSSIHSDPTKDWLDEYLEQEKLKHKFQADDTPEPQRHAFSMGYLKATGTNFDCLLVK